MCCSSFTLFRVSRANMPSLAFLEPCIVPLPIRETPAAGQRLHFGLDNSRRQADNLLAGRRLHDHQ